MDIKNNSITFKQKVFNDLLNEKLKCYQKRYVDIINSKIKLEEDHLNLNSLDQIQYEVCKSRLGTLMDIRRSLTDLEIFSNTDFNLLDKIFKLFGVPPTFPTKPTLRHKMEKYLIMHPL